MKEKEKKIEREKGGENLKKKKKSSFQIVHRISEFNLPPDQNFDMHCKTLYSQKEANHDIRLSQTMGHHPQRDLNFNQ